MKKNINVEKIKGLWNLDDSLVVEYARSNDNASYIIHH